MNIKFKNNLEKNSVIIEVTISPRKTLKEERKRVRFNDIIKLLKQNYSPPDTHTLGECISNIHIKLDNDYKNSLAGKWTFSLIPKKIRATKPRTRKPAKKA